MSTEQTQEQQQEQKCPAGGDQQTPEATEGYPTFDQAMATICRTIFTEMEDYIKDDEGKAAFRESVEAPDSGLRHMIRCAFISGVHYSLQLPPIFVMKEWQREHLKSIPDAEALLAKMRAALSTRSDEVPEEGKQSGGEHGGQ